jgi:hypothetical protein
MHADAGDELVVESPFCGGAPRKGEILDVRAEGGHEHYIVRWDDNGHEALFFPGPTTHVCTPTVAQRSGDGHDAHD